jgi:hypothetical protein
MSARLQMDAFRKMLGCQVPTVDLGLDLNDRVLLHSEREERMRTSSPTRLPV